MATWMACLRSMHSASGFLTALVVMACTSINHTTLVQRDKQSLTIQTKYGSVKGTRRNLSFSIDGGVTTVVDEFLNIPYAVPPVGDRRFRPPEPPESWDHERDCTRYGWICPQTPWNNSTLDQFQNEDCLYLHIFSPHQASQPSPLFPVMVFIHGGSYEYGTGNRYNGSALAQNGVVVVTFNYRLALLGFLSSGTNELPGNIGLLDQVAALKWVRDNIRQFGGDPDIVTIFGSSAGGASVGLLMMSPLGKDLFHRAIAQSGTANAMWATSKLSSDEHQHRFKHLARNLSCDVDNQTIEDIIECLRRTPLEHLKLQHVCKFIECLGVDPPMKPVVDGVVLPHSPIDILQSGEYTRVPYMTGTVRAEFGQYFGSDFSLEQMEREVADFLRRQYGFPATEAVKFHYTDWTRPSLDWHNGPLTYRQHFNSAEVLTDMGLVAPTAEMARYMSKNTDMDVYTYYFDNYECYHSIELNYVFGTPYVGGQVDEIERLSTFTELDRKSSRIFMKLWSDFAKYGKPVSAMEVLNTEWNKTITEQENYLHITSTREVISAEINTKYKASHVALWNILVSNMAKVCRNCEMTTFCDNSKTWIFFGLVIGLISTVIILLCAIIWSHRGMGTARENSYALLRRGSSQRSGAYGLVL